MIWVDNSCVYWSICFSFFDFYEKIGWTDSSVWFGIYRKHWPTVQGSGASVILVIEVVKLCTTSSSLICQFSFYTSNIWYFDVFRCLVPKYLLNRRGLIGGGCSTKVLHFQPWLGFCCMVSWSWHWKEKKKRTIEENKRNEKAGLHVQQFRSVLLLSIFIFFFIYDWDEK